MVYDAIVAGAGLWGCTIARRQVPRWTRICKESAGCFGKNGLKMPTALAISNG